MRMCSYVSIDIYIYILVRFCVAARLVVSVRAAILTVGAKNLALASSDAALIPQNQRIWSVQKRSSHVHRTWLFTDAISNG